MYILYIVLINRRSYLRLNTFTLFTILRTHLRLNLLPLWLRGAKKKDFTEINSYGIFVKR